ncbi:MAG TPA: HEXXH motif-containing putative peptide modification protein [Dongiaceae bacterium]|nr:HEXXH motif-containing putative peptide modification protein [Dongiaceae bacterium]
MATGSFAPDRARAAQAAAAIDSSLLASFDHLAEACAAQLDIEGGGLRKLRCALAAGRVASPAHYAVHFALLDAIAEEDDAALRRCFALLGDAEAIDPEQTLSRRVAVLDSDAIGSDIAALYLRNIDADEARPLNLMPPPLQSVPAARSLIEEATALIGRIAPELAGEIVALVRQILLASDRPGAPHPFCGASSFFLWGAVCFNPLRHAGAYQAAETLVHEAAHILLTALAKEEPLVRNPHGARYRSPVRTDPRPMEGIYHATFVLARTCWFHRAAAATADLPQAMRKQAEQAAEQDSRYFLDGFATVMARAELSGLGRALIEDAARFVRDGV